MKLDLTGWEKNWGLMNAFFDVEEIKKIRKRIRNLEVKHVVFCSLESRFAKSGGLGAVTTKILPHLNRIRQGVILMTPFYPNIIDSEKLSPAGIEPFDVIYDGRPIEVELYKYTVTDNEAEGGIVEEYYIKASGFFGACNKINDPYRYYPDDSQSNDEAILENALFFCKAVPAAVYALGLRENIVFHLQDWQTAPIALTSKEAMLDGTLTSCGSVQTMHNLFDSWLSEESLAKITDNKKIHSHKAFAKQNGINAYQLGLQLVDAPLTTVSMNFADELTGDLLQTGHFAPHLQDIFKKSGVYGINNGLFIDFAPEFAGEKTAALTLKEIKQIKLQKRKALLKILATYHPDERFGRLTYQSNSITRLPNKIPILVMSGRLDPLQKGFDVLLRALEAFKEDEVKVVLTPMAVRHSDLDYFHEVASRCSGNITVFPMRMEKGYNELQMGSTFGIMPSIYEPFGAAIEYMVSGTVTLARNTGGLADQILHRECGLLYKEECAFYTLENISDFSKSCDIVQIRKRNKWAQSMAERLYAVIKDAIKIYQNHPDTYYNFILKGLERAAIFTWEDAAKKYFEVYNKISK
ncbi:MAG: glycogen synthase [bacterium]|nr:glycogen synthase [bacterium]